MQRTLSLDVYDYTGHALCSLYDSSNDMVGQAHDVFVHTERNGFKELRFSLPSICEDEKNYRLNFLISDYRIRYREVKSNTEEIDWFLISEPKVTHDAFSTDYEVRARHISQLLNTKNLNLEFSDNEGNNTGTIKQIAEAILEGTGWHLGNVATFWEEDKYNLAGKEKVRSFTASAKTGAFKMMSDLCEMFDAKPVYHGEETYEEDGVQKTGRTVDILPINPFSEKLDEGVIPPDLNKNKVLELYYDKNIGNISRTLNSDSLVTVLSAYGSYGDRNGLASLQNAEHAEITFDTLDVGNYKFVHNQANYYFSVDEQTSNLKWSSLDFVSRSYVYNGTKLFEVYKEAQEGISYTSLEVQPVYVKNKIPYIMDFSYYRKIGLLDDNMLLELAQAQTALPSKHITAEEASLALSDAKDELSRTASSGGGFLMLDVYSSDIVDGQFQLTLNKDIYPNGVIFRSDYDESKRNYFSWNTATGIKDSGEAIGGRGAVVYVVHQGNPTKWEKSYVKTLGNGVDDYYRDSLGNTYYLHTKVHREDYDHFPVVGTADIIYVADDTEKMYTWFNNNYQEIQASGYFYGLNEFDEPLTIKLWSTEDTWHSGDKVYLFSADAIAGVFGPREDSVYSNRKSIEEAVKVSTETHPVYFITDNDTVPSQDACLSSYGWYYKSYQNTYSFGDLYFCWGKNGDLGWNKVYVSNGDENPEKISIISGYNYYYSLKRSLAYIAVGTSYTPINNTVEEKSINNAFAAVIDGCINQEILTKGVSERYNYNDSYSSLPIGNYAFKNEYNNYWLFTTDMVIQNPSLIHYISADKILWQDNDEHHILKAIEHSFRVLDFPKNNELTDTIFSKMGYSNGVFETEGNKQVSNNIYVHDNTEYEFSLPFDSIVVCLAENQSVLAEVTTSPFTTPNHTTHVRVVANSIPTNAQYLRVKDYDKVFFSKNKKYTILNSTAVGERLGMSYLMDKFIDLCHEAYQVKLPALTQAQQEITDINLYLSEMLGDMYREGYWQDNNFVEGDEDKLYSDSLDNLKEISHPQATYDFKYLDLYGIDDNLDANIKIEYPDIDTDYAVHLVDPDIDTNRWAYIDKLDKCYDQTWKTQIEVNTRLSMIGQQSFTDVLAKIAEVANETKAKQTIYSKAEVIGNAGQLAADKLEGLIQANKIYIMGGTSNWYTDSKGNIIFEDADGNSAMMLTGRGLLISSSRDPYGDWAWKTALSGKGFNCDVIATGEFSAKHIIAGTITTDKLSSSVGQELEIGSNKALMLYATVDGKRPVDGLETKHPDDGDSYIKIAAKNGNDPAYIDIQSGGKLNLYGGSSVRIESGGKLDLIGATMNLESAGKIYIKSGTTLDIDTNLFTVNSTNFKIQKNNVTNDYDVTIKGNITTTGGKIAGFTIGSTQTLDYMYTNSKQAINNAQEGIYIGTDGFGLGSTVNVGTTQSPVYKSKFQVNKDGSLFAQDATITGSITANTGHIGDFTISSSLYTNNKTAIDTDVDGVFIGSAGIGVGRTYNWGTSQSPIIRSKLQFDNTGNFYASNAHISGQIESTTGHIGGWTINSSSITGNKTGLAKTTNDTDIAFWAGNATASSALFKVTQGGALTSTSADIKGTIKATSLYIGATSSSNGTQLKLDTNGLVMSNSATAATAVRTTAGIKIDTSGVVIDSTKTDVAGVIKTAAGIKVDASGVVISSSSTASTAVQTAAGIKVGANGVVIGSDKTENTAVLAAAGITVDATTGVAIKSSGTAGSTSASKIGALTVTSGKIDISCTNIGDSSSSGIYISPTKIQAKSTGDVDFSTAKSFKIAAGSISMTAISDYTPVDISGKYDKISNINITSNGVDISGNKHINLDVNSNNYVHLSQDGIALKGSRITILDSNNNSYPIWGRDDIIVLKKSDNEQTVINSMSGKHDWVLIKPYYSAKCTYNASSLSTTGMMTRISGSAFGDGASWYKYTIKCSSFTATSTTAQQFTATLTFNLGNTSSANQLSTSSIAITVYQDGRVVETGNEGANWRALRDTGLTITSNNPPINLCGNDSSMYFNVTCTGRTLQQIVFTVECECDTTNAKVPCTVYYYP